MEDLTDEQLLSCPEATEPTFIHRGRRDSISTQAGKEKQKKKDRKAKEQVQMFLNITSSSISKYFNCNNR